MKNPITAMGRDELIAEIRRMEAATTLTKEQWAALKKLAKAYKPQLRDSETTRKFARVDVSAAMVEGQSARWTIAAVFSSHGRGSVRHISITEDTLQAAYLGMVERLGQVYRKWE